MILSLCHANSNKYRRAKYFAVDFQQCVVNVAKGVVRAPFRFGDAVLSESQRCARCVVAMGKDACRCVKTNLYQVVDSVSMIVLKMNRD